LSEDFFGYGNAARPETPRTVLADLSGEDWEKFISFAAQRSYPAGASVVKVGSSAPALILVASGRLRVQAAVGPASLRGEGEMVGLLSFLDGAPSDVAVSVDGPGAAELLLLTPDALQRLAAWKPRIAIALLRDLGANVAARLRRLQPGD
jgi:CRP-like cAMP-binding protein